MIRTARIRAAGTEFECAMLDLSASGARLLIPSSVGLADIFLWRLLLQPPGQGYRHAVKRWQIGEEVGFEFVEADILEGAVAADRHAAPDEPERRHAGWR